MSWLERWRSGAEAACSPAVLPLHGIRVTLGRANRVLEALQAAGREGMRRLQTRRRPLVFLSATSLSQGDTLAVQVAVPPPRTPLGHIRNLLVDTLGGGLVEVRYADRAMAVHLKRKGLLRALIPTTPLDPAGLYHLDIHLRDGRHEPLRIPMQLHGRKFAEESVWLADTASLSLGEYEYSRVKHVTSIRSAKQWWTGRFHRPCGGSLSSEYGRRRYYNGQWARNYFHEGVDYAETVGTTVTSPADGIVKLVGYEKQGFSVHGYVAQGNCVGVDHGHGVVSLLVHLHTVGVRAGQVVRTGDKLGEVGSTGRSTGPHLHWGLYVGGQAVDPEPWMKEKERELSDLPIWAV